MATCNCNSILPSGVNAEVRAWSTYTLYFKPASPYTWEDLTECYLTAICAGDVLFRLSMSDAVVDFDNGQLAWSLTQEQTGAFPVGQRVRFYIDPLTSDGERGSVEPFVVLVTESGVDGEIPISEVDNE